MFCYQCQETFENRACTVQGVCGKTSNVANLQDLLIFILQGIALYADELPSEEFNIAECGKFIGKALFATITNANFDPQGIVELIKEAIGLRNRLRIKSSVKINHDSAVFEGSSMDDFLKKASDVGILSYSDDKDSRSLKSTILYGMKGTAAYAYHAAILGFYSEEIYRTMIKGLKAIAQETSFEKLLDTLGQVGDNCVRVMKLLDEANTASFGCPEMTKVNIGVKKNPAILVSGHDLKDLEELLKQTQGKGIDVYTHCEMLPAHYYPGLKKYKHLVGNYGGAWWTQNKDFEDFNGPILMTTNCLTPVKGSYKDRIFTTATTGYPGVKHIPDSKDGGSKDFSEIINLAKTCPSPKKIESGKIIGGFSHSQVLAIADDIVNSIKSKRIKRFIVMGGCDGRSSKRQYYANLAKMLPKDTIILTAGCAKFRYIKLNLGNINAIPRVLDAGQCNDCYSLAVIAMKLKEALGLNDVNELPISFDIAWFEQKAVTVLLALLSLGFKNIRLGPTLPAFLSEGVLKIISDKYNVKCIRDNPADDIDDLLRGK